MNKKNKKIIKIRETMSKTYQYWHQNRNWSISAFNSSVL